MNTNNKLVKDYLGNLIPKSKAHKIMGKYYEEDVSCFLMEDGQWYRKTSTDKIIYDNYSRKYVLKNSCSMINGIINKEGEIGLFSENDFTVNLVDVKGRTSAKICLNDQIAKELGYIECLSDGNFYKEASLDAAGLESMKKKAIPSHERSKSYNLAADPEKWKQLQNIYEKLELKIEPSSQEISRFIGDYSFGMEMEFINGFLPKRIRQKYGLKALKDGSLRHENGEGLEVVTVPMAGAKGIQVEKEFIREASIRCEVNNLCSVHFHFGNVRKDKLFVLSLYNTMSLIQSELIKYFPYSRVNTIKADGKVYCTPLPDLKMKFGYILKSKDEEEFKFRTVTEFNKLYTWLNNGKSLAEEYGKREIVRETVIRNGKKMFHDKWLKNIYTTKNVYHAVEGEKWNKTTRYLLLNFLNLFFSKSHTLEFRLAEGSTNPTKILSWQIICASILRYAEDIKRGLSNTSLRLEDILKAQLPEKYSTYLMEYMKSRNTVFFNSAGEYKSWKSVEQLWFSKDNSYKFVHNNFEIK